MLLDILSAHTGSAATNMATDFLLLQHYPSPHARLRTYGWTRPAVTFGYSQRIAWVREQLPDADDIAEWCRRPTGGGVVDHRNDWTYALVIPRGHPLGDAPAVQGYEAVHRALVDALISAGVPAELKTTCDPCAADAPRGPGVCFTQPERFDAVRSDDGRKLAGAAQKRSKRGLLFQGSIARAAVGDIDWDAFRDAFIARLSEALACPAAPTPWPENWDDAIDALAEDYATPEWNERR